MDAADSTVPDSACYHNSDPTTDQETSTVYSNTTTNQETSTVYSNTTTDQETSTVHSDPTTDQETSTVHSDPTTDQEKRTVRSDPTTDQETSTVHSEPTTDQETSTVHSDPTTDQETSISNSNPNAANSRPLTVRRVMIFFTTSFVYFLTWSCVSMWAPFFPGEAEKRGVSDTEVGFIFGTYSMVAFLSSLVYGPFVIPQIGPYFVLFSGLFLCGGANFICGYVNLIQDHVTFSLLCFAVRAVGALGGSACETSIVVILTQEFPETLAFVIGLLEIFSGLGFVVGPVLGGVFYSLGGFRLPMVVVGGTLLVFLPLIWILLPRQDYIGSEDPQDRLELFKRAISIPGVIIMCFSGCICIISLSFLEPTLQSHAEKFGVNSTGVALLFLSASSTYTLVAPIAGYILNRKLWGRMFNVVGSLGTSIFLMLLGPAPFLKPYLPKKALWLLIVSLMGAGLFDGLLIVPILPEMLRCSYERGLEKGLELDSLLSGFYTGFLNLGAFVGPSVGGILNDQYGFSWTATIVGFLMAGQFLVISIFYTCNRQRSVTVGLTEHEPLISSERTIPDYS